MEGVTGYTCARCGKAFTSEAQMTWAVLEYGTKLIPVCADDRVCWEKEPRTKIQRRYICKKKSPRQDAKTILDLR